MRWSKEIEEVAIKILLGLVRIDTSNPPGRESEAVAYLQKILAAEEIETMVIEKKDGRGNLIARIAGGNEKPLILLSHLDVALVDHAEWQVPPFSAVEKDGFIWGRGTLDTKQLTVMELMAMVLLKRSGTLPDRDVYLVATADEEAGSTWGMKAIANELPGSGLVLNEGGGFFLSVGSQKFLLLAAGEKGAARVKLKATGLGGHAACPSSTQAIFKLARALGILLQEKFSAEATLIEKRFRRCLMGESETTEELLRYMAGTTVIIRNIDAGKGTNVIPSIVAAELELRFPPTLEKSALQARLGEIFGNDDVEWELSDYQPGYQSSLVEEFPGLLARQARRWGGNLEVLPILALGRTDGRFLGWQGADVYGFSPTDEHTPWEQVLQQVHQKDERIARSSFLFGARVIWEVVAELCLQR